MAKKGRMLVMMRDPETGYFIVRSRNPRKQNLKNTNVQKAKSSDKLSFKRYVPKLRKHVLLVEQKLK